MGAIAGYAQADITPPLGVAMDGYASRDRGASGVADPLLAQALYLADGEQSCLLVTMDICSLPGELLERLRKAISSATGVPANAVVLSPTHTHFGPALVYKPWMPSDVSRRVSQQYAEDFLQTVTDVTARACGAAVEACLFVGRSQAPGISFNRRPLGADGRCANRLRLPPAQAAAASLTGWRLRQGWPAGGWGGPRYSSPDARVEGLRLGVTDPEVVVLRVQRADGLPLAAVVNFACHPVCGGEDFYALSADYPSYLRRVVSAALRAAHSECSGMQDTPAVMFAQGAAGDQVPAWREGQARVRVGQGLGGAALLAWHTAQPLEDHALRVATAEIELPLRSFPPADEIRPQLEKARREGGDATRLGFMLAMSELIGQRRSARVSLTALRMGQWAMVNGVGEIVAEIGLHIKQRSPIPYTMFVSLSADHFGYMTTDEAMREGGYEAEWSGLDFGSATAQISGALDALALTV